jgi:hypothetical protein
MALACGRLGRVHLLRSHTETKCRSQADNPQATPFDTPLPPNHLAVLGFRFQS